MVGLRILILLGSVGALGAQSNPASDEWRRAVEDFEWSFPRDHGSHAGFRSEWWYLTGHVEAPDGRRFGYQFTFFRVGLLPEPTGLDSDWAATDLVMGHAALTDVSSDTHRFSDLLYRATPLLGGFTAATDPLGDSLLVWSRAPAGTPGRWTLHFNGAGFDLHMRDDEAGFSMTLSTRPSKPIVFHGPNGFSVKSDGPDPSASQYYSFTRLHTEGQIAVDGDTLQVSGNSWMDKEFGSDKLAENQSGWDWFSLQLEDGRELMLYMLRNHAGNVDFASGSMVAADGTRTHLDASAYRVVAEDNWTSPRTGASYPARWRVEIAAESWTVRSLRADQENVGRQLPDLFYWEGAVEVTGHNGAASGRGYVELTGYGTSLRPGF